jgi:hypothetical protein
MANSGADCHSGKHEEQAVIVEEDKGGEETQKGELRPRID